MKLETKTDPFPHVIVTEMFTDEELASVRLELEYLSDYQALVELHDGTFANRLNLYDFFVDGDDSAIGRLVNEKVFSVEVLGSFPYRWMTKLYDSMTWDKIYISKINAGESVSNRGKTIFSTQILLDPREAPITFPVHNYTPLTGQGNCGIIYLSAERSRIAADDTGELVSLLQVTGITNKVEY